MKKLTAVLLALAFGALMLQPITRHVNTQLSMNPVTFDGDPIVPPPPPPPRG
jgi:hypothetical protein